ncbi:MAG: hypothetical protein HDT22_11250 [Ruminococcus sp.]|nr:hypothetical protein [Ruminococcus sp.]
MDKNLGIAQDYDRSNYDSASAKKAYKEKVFGDSAVITDSTTGEILHKSQTAAQKKYHMKNADGENVSKKWAEHSAETDHINSLKSIHDKVKHNPFLSDDDIQEIANCDANLRVLPKSLNASKGEKSDIEIIFDTDNGLSLKGRVHLAGEKIKSDTVLTEKLIARTGENIGGLAVDSAKKSVEDNAMKFVRYGVDHIADVATGEKTLEDAVADVGAFAVETVGKDVIKNVADSAGEKIKSDTVLTDKLIAHTDETIGGLAIKSIEDNAMKFMRYGVDHIVGVATGEKTLEDAVADVGAFAVGTVGKDIIKNVADTAGEKIKLDTVLTDKLIARTGETIGGLAVNSAKKSVEDNAMKFMQYGVDHIADVATGEKTLEDAVADVGAFAVETVGKDVIKNVADSALVNNTVYQSLKNSGALGQLIQVGAIVAESTSRLIDGEITADEFMLEIGDKGATMVAQMIGSEVGAVVGEIIGISAGGILGAGAGEIIGRAIGTMIATVACNVIIAVRTNIINNLKSLDDYKLKEKAIRKLETEAIAEMEYQRQKFRNIVENEYQKWDKNIESGFDMIIVSACKEVYDLQGIINGLDKILSVFGKSVMFKNLDEYELQLDMPLKLNF